MCADNASFKARKAFGWLRIRLKKIIIIVKNNTINITTTRTVHLLSKGLRLVTYYRILCKRHRGNSYAHAQTLLRTFPSLRLLQMVGHEQKEHALKA